MFHYSMTTSCFITPSALTHYYSPKFACHIFSPWLYVSLLAYVCLLCRFPVSTVHDSVKSLTSGVSSALDRFPNGSCSTERLGEPVYYPPNLSLSPLSALAINKAGINYTVNKIPVQMYYTLHYQIMIYKCIKESDDERIEKPDLQS